MNSNCLIRKPALNDLDDICQILKDNNRGDSADALRLLKEKGLSENLDLLMFECDGDVAGLIICDKLTETLVNMDWFLKNEYKHRNLGTYLTRVMSSQILAGGCDCQMSFPTSDPVKLSIVRKLGFTRVEGSLKKLVYIKRLAR